MANKIKFNLKNVHYAPLSFSGTTPIYSTPVPIPGAVSLAMEGNGDAQDFYIGGVYYSISYDTGYEGELDIAVLPESFRTYALGETLDSNKVLVEKEGSRLRPFALLFEFNGDETHIRHVLYNCIAKRPKIAGKTKTQTTEVDTETFSISAESLPGGVIKAKTGDSTTQTIYNGWFSSVYFIPGNTQSQDDFTAFTVDGVSFMGLCEISRVSDIKASDISGLLLDKTYFNDVIGTFLQYDITLALPMYDRNDYDELYELLTKPIDGHSFTIDYGQTQVQITGRVENVKDSHVRTRGGDGYWDGLQFSVIANHPSKTMDLDDVLTMGMTPLPANPEATVGDLYEYTQGGWVQRFYADADDIYY